jgi:hypothetical protein
MHFFGLEIFDGKPQKQVNIDENISLQEQWFHLTQDILCIQYEIHDVMVFWVGVGWYPTAEVTPESYFRVQVLEGPYTEGAVFYEKESKTIQQMKIDLKEAIDLVQNFKNYSPSDIVSKKIRDSRISQEDLDDIMSEDE